MDHSNKNEMIPIVQTLLILAVVWRNVQDIPGLGPPGWVRNKKGLHFPGRPRRDKNTGPNILGRDGSEMF